MSNNITDNGYNDCTGCSACALCCPNSAIKIINNTNGFFTPILDENICMKCGLCKEVCYKYLDDSNIISREDYKGKKVLAVLNNYLEEMRLVTTTGVATQLAKYYYKEGYDVCGVIFSPDSDVCEHIVAIGERDITEFKGSKYLQSYCLSAFKTLYESSKKSIVFGTPCQIYGLRQFIKLKKIEHKFILVDLFCAGVPSLNLWKQYKDFLKRVFEIQNINHVSFRDKTQGWHKFSMKIIDETGTKYKQNLFNDLFFSFYLKKVCFCKSCYTCKLRHDTVSSDIRLGDFWGDKYMIFDDGVGLVVVMTEKGEEVWQNIKYSFRFEECKTKDIFTSQKINKIEVPDMYDAVIDALSKKENLEIINAKFKINEIGYKYKIDET